MARRPALYHRQGRDYRLFLSGRHHHAHRHHGPARIGQDLGHRLEGIRKRYATVYEHLDPGTRRSIVDRLDFLHRQSTEALGGLEKQLGGLPRQHFGD